MQHPNNHRSSQQLSTPACAYTDDLSIDHHHHLLQSTKFGNLFFGQPLFPNFLRFFFLCRCHFTTILSPQYGQNSKDTSSGFPSNDISNPHSPIQSPSNFSSHLHISITPHYYVFLLIKCTTLPHFIISLKFTQSI